MRSLKATVLPPSTGSGVLPATSLKAVPWRRQKGGRLSRRIIALVATCHGCRWRTSVIRLSPTTASRDQRARRSEEHTSELQSQSNLVCRLLLEKKKRRSQQRR